MLRDATGDLLAFTSFPPGYWKKIWSTEIIESLPGLGPILGAEFLVAIGGNLTGFATAGRLAPYAGLVPVAQDSGRVTGNLRRPERYNRRLRRVFYMAALSSIRVSGPSRTFYDRKRGERLIHTQALLVLDRRLVDVLWALLRDNRKFTPTAPQPAISGLTRSFRFRADPAGPLPGASDRNTEDRTVPQIQIRAV